MHPLSPVLGLKTDARMKALKSCVRHRSREGWICMDFFPSVWLVTISNWDWSYETPQRHWIQYSLTKTWKHDASGSLKAKIGAWKKPIKRTWAQGYFLLISLYSWKSICMEGHDLWRFCVWHPEQCKTSAHGRICTFESFGQGKMSSYSKMVRRRSSEVSTLSARDIFHWESEIKDGVD